MYRRTSLPTWAEELAARQGGLLTRRQSLDAIGRTPLRGLVARDRWRCVTEGIYLPAPTEPTDQHRLWAGYLTGGAGAAVGGRGALFLAGVVPAFESVDVWIAPTALRTSRVGYVFRRDGTGRLDHVVGTLPRIRTEEALIDVGQQLDVEDWVALLAEATRMGVVALPEVVRRIDLRTRVAQRGMLRGVALDLGGVESTLEWIYREKVERAHRLPGGLRQVSVVRGWRCDVRYEDHGLIVELDGQIHLQRIFRDLDRDNQHALTGSATLRYGSVDLRGRPCVVARQVGAALSARGWAGTVGRCRACPDATVEDR